MNHADQLHVALEQDNCSAGVNLQVSHVFSMMRDVLLDGLYGLQAGQFRLENVSIMADLRECQSLCLEGERSVCIDMLLNILLQLVTQQPERETRICVTAGEALISREKLFCLLRLLMDRQWLLVQGRISADRCRRLLEVVVDGGGIKDAVVCILEPCLTDSLQLPAHEEIHQLR